MVYIKGGGRVEAVGEALDTVMEIIKLIINSLKQFLVLANCKAELSYPVALNLKPFYCIYGR